MLKQSLLRRPFLVSTLYFPLYLIFFQWLQTRSVAHTWLHLSIDDHIPFCSWFVIPYLLWFFFVAAVVLWVLHTPEESLRLSAFLYGGMTVCLLIYAFFPNGQTLRPAFMPDHSPLTQLVFFLYQIDPPVNVCPSIHVYATIGVQNALLRSPELRNHPLLQSLTMILSALIILSTMFLKQHSVADVLAAFLLASVMGHLVYHRAGAVQPVPVRLRKLPS